jgi:N-acetylneuraminic acid mutarotase
MSMNTTLYRLAIGLSVLISSAFAIPQNSTSKGCWKTLAPLAGGTRQEHGAARIGTDVYVVGGVNAMKLATQVEKYDTVNNKWSQVAPIPMGMHHPNVAALDGKLYVLGGMTTTTGVGGIWPAIPNTYVFDPAKNAWSGLAPMPDQRGSAAMGVNEKTKKIYLAGGLPSMGRAVDRVSSYDTVADKWEALPNFKLPEGRDHGGGLVIGDTWYVVGGRVGIPTALRNTTWARSLTDPSAQWQNVGTMRTGRGGIAVAATSTKIYAFGGEGNPKPGTRGVFSNAESFDLATKTWLEEAPMKVPRHGTAAVAVGEWVYVPGGGAQSGGGADVATVDAFGPGPC